MFPSLSAGIASGEVEPSLLKHCPQMRPKNNRADNQRSNRRDKNRSRRHILGVAHKGMKLGRSRIGEKLEGRIERLRRPDNRDDEDNPAPFRRGNMEKECCRNHNHRGYRVDPRVVLATNHAQDARNRMAKTADAPSELKWSGHRAWLRSRVLH